jgi:hypothetical protein
MMYVYSCMFSPSYIFLLSLVLMINCYFHSFSKSIEFANCIKCFMGFVLLPYVAFLLPDGTCVPLPLPYYHFFPAFRFWSLSLTSTLIADGKVTRLVCCLPFEIPFPWGPNGDRCCWHHVFKREGKELHKCHL